MRSTAVGRPVENDDGCGIEWQADADGAHEALLDASQHDAGDYFVFEIERTSRTPDQLGGSARFNVHASLAGRLFERFVLDVGFKRKENEPVGRVALPDDLAFAGVESAEIGAIPGAPDRGEAARVHANLRCQPDQQSYQGSC